MEYIVGFKATAHNIHKSTACTLTSRSTLGHVTAQKWRKREVTGVPSKVTNEVGRVVALMGSGTIAYVAKM